MKHLLRFIKHLSILLFISLPLQLIGSILLLAYLPFSKNNKLPYLLRWYDNADVYTDRDSSTYLNTVIPQGWWIRYLWLAWRNPLNYFGYMHLGLVIPNDYKDLEYYNSSLLGEIGDATNCVEGYFYREISFNNTTAYEYYLIKKFIFPYDKSTRCVRIRVGYKLGQDKPIKNHIAQNVFVISPFHSYNGH